MTVRRVPVPTATLAPSGTTNAYVVGDDAVLLVDPPAASADLEAAIDGRTVDHIAVTHAHPDHVGGVAHYADRTGATVWARRGRTDRFERATGVTPDRVFEEGTRLPLGDETVTVLDTPGHAPDHVTFEVGDALLCGDLAVAEGSVVVGAPEGDLRGYLVALRRLLARDPTVAYPGHGSVLDAPRATFTRLVSHRRHRERRVLDAVQSGARDPDAVLDDAYEKDLTGVRDLARATVVAHIEKLAAERRVRWDSETERVAPV